ncbi:MAG TPA: hypothetical protein VHG91_20345 [Longimicrobium sp.]|nr:hypothetical protein [Longimicrobium sp.]
MSSLNLELSIINVRCVDETEHEGLGEWVANDDVRLRALLLSEDSDAHLTEIQTPTFLLGDNYQDGTAVATRVTLGSVRVLATQAFPVGVSAGLFLFEEDWFGDMGAIEGAIRGYADAARTAHGLLSTIIGLFPGPWTRIASGIGSIAAVVEPLIAHLVLAAGNDLFPPRDVTLLLPAFAADLAAADRRGIVTFEGHGGTYQLTYEWRTRRDRWTLLDANPRTRLLAADGRELYQLHDDGKVWRFTGTGWAMIDRNPATVHIAASGGALYQMHRDGKIWRYTGTPLTGWELLDRNPATREIFADGPHLYQRHADGKVWRYTGPPLTGWELLDQNPATAQIAAAGGALYQRHRDGKVWRFTGPPLTGWELLDQNPATRRIAAGGDQLYQLHHDGKIWRYTGPPLTGWELIDHNPATRQIVASGAHLYQVHDGGSIWHYTGPPVTGWARLDANPATREVVASGPFVYQRHSDGKVWMHAV